MKCTNCGADVGPEDVFCSDCGAQLPRQQGRGKALPIIIGVVVAIVAGACICLAVAYTIWPSEPTPAQTTLASPTPSLAPTPTVPAWPLVLEEDFDDAESEFSEGSYENRRYFYEGGRYGIEKTKADEISWSTMGDYSDFVIEVDVTSEEETGEAGLVFRREDSYQLYVFTFTPDGRYRLRRLFEQGEEGWVAIRDYTESSHLVRGVGTNRLRVVCEGPEISLWVNDQYLETVHDSTLAEGELGLAVGTFDEPYALFYFDNLRVYAAPSPSAVLWQDDFGDPASGWEVGEYPGGSVKYEDGAYLVTADTAGNMWGVANRFFDDGTIEVDATQVVGPANDNTGYGIICRAQSNGDGYYLRISGDGFYGIHKVVDGESEPLVDWTKSDVINQGNSLNQIRVVCNGTELELSANGELLAEVSDSTFTEGDVALVATSFEADEPAEIGFDNLVVYSAVAE